MGKDIDPKDVALAVGISLLLNQIINADGPTPDNFSPFTVTPYLGPPQGAGNLVYATPNGAAGEASLRVLLPADMPTLPALITSLASGIAAAQALYPFAGGALGLGEFSPSADNRVRSAAWINVTANVPRLWSGGTERSLTVALSGAAGQAVTFRYYPIAAPGGDFVYGVGGTVIGVLALGAATATFAFTPPPGEYVISADQAGALAESGYVLIS